MKAFVVALMVTLTSGSAFAHGGAQGFDSEQEEIEIMLKTELSQLLEVAALLSNTILSKEVDENKKCAYLKDLEVVNANLDLTINDFERLAIGNVGMYGAIDHAYSEQQMLKKMYAENFRSQWINYNASIATFQKNLSCQ